MRVSSAPVCRFWLRQQRQLMICLTSYIKWLIAKIDDKQRRFSLSQLGHDFFSKSGILKAVNLHPNPGNKILPIQQLTPPSMMNSYIKTCAEGNYLDRTMVDIRLAKYSSSLIPFLYFLRFFSMLFTSHICLSQTTPKSWMNWNTMAWIVHKNMRAILWTDKHAFVQSVLKVPHAFALKFTPVWDNKLTCGGRNNLRGKTLSSTSRLPLHWKKGINYFIDALSS